MKTLKGVIFLIMFGFLLGSCVAKKIVSTSVKTDTKVFAKSNYVLVLKPFLRYEMIFDGAILPDEGEDKDFARKQLTAIAKKYCDLRYANIVNLNDLTDKNIVNQFDRLQQLSPRLARGIINEEAKSIFQQINASNNEYLVLVQFFNVKIGPRGTWDPNSGAITSNMSNSILWSALINCKSGEVKWSSTMTYRTIPELKGPDFFKSCEDLYQDFPKL